MFGNNGGWNPAQDPQLQAVAGALMNALRKPYGSDPSDGEFAYSPSRRTSPLAGVDDMYLPPNSMSGMGYGGPADKSGKFAPKAPITPIHDSGESLARGQTGLVNNPQTGLPQYVRADRPVQARPVDDRELEDSLYQRFRASANARGEPGDAPLVAVEDGVARISRHGGDFYPKPGLNERAVYKKPGVDISRLRAMARQNMRDGMDVDQAWGGALNFGQQLGDDAGPDQNILLRSLLGGPMSDPSQMAGVAAHERIAGRGLDIRQNEVENQLALGVGANDILRTEAETKARQAAAMERQAENAFGLDKIRLQNEAERLKIESQNATARANREQAESDARIRAAGIDSDIKQRELDDLNNPAEATARQELALIEMPETPPEKRIELEVKYANAQKRGLKQEGQVAKWMRDQYANDLQDQDTWFGDNSAEQLARHASQKLGLNYSEALPLARVIVSGGTSPTEQAWAGAVSAALLPGVGGGFRVGPGAGSAFPRGR